MITNDFFNTLPPDTTRHRILRTADAAEFLGISVVHLRRLSQRGLVPAPIRLSACRLGWRLGDLIDWLATRQLPPGGLR